MKYLLSILLPILLFSCSHYNYTNKTDARKYIKEYLFCSCLQQGITQFSKPDSLEMSKALVYDLISGYYNYKWITKVLDSIAKVEIEQQIKTQFDTTKHESAYGRVTYHLSCLEFYQSKKADSIAKFFDKYLYKG